MLEAARRIHDCSDAWVVYERGLEPLKVIERDFTIQNVQEAASANPIEAFAARAAGRNVKPGFIIVTNVITVFHNTSMLNQPSK